MNNSDERVQQLEAGKTGKISIRARKRGAVFDGEGSQMCIHDQLASCLCFYEDVLEYRPVAFPRFKQGEARAVQPACNHLNGLRNCQRPLKNTGIGGEPKEGKHNSPRQRRRLGARKRMFKPASRG